MLDYFQLQMSGAMVQFLFSRHLQIFKNKQFKTNCCGKLLVPGVNFGDMCPGHYGAQR
jgi:hypothetical protein